MLGLNQRSYSALGPVSAGMGDRVQVKLPVHENLSQCIINHPGQFSLAVPLWVGTVHTSDGIGHH